MAKQEVSTELKRDEFSKIFDEYRAKIEEITRRSEQNFHINDIISSDKQTDEDEHIEVVSASSGDSNENVQTQPENELSPTVEPSTEPENFKESESTAKITETVPMESPITPEITDNGSNGKRPVVKESSEIIEQAKREASRIIEEAETSVKKEAKKKTQAQVDKIIEKAKKEADEIITRANKSADKVRDEVISESKKEADAIIREITQKYRQETEAKSSHVIAEAQEKANKMLAEASASTQQASKHIVEIVHRARQLANDMETSLLKEIDELNNIIGETREKLEETSKPTKEEKKFLSPSPKQVEEINSNPTLAIRLIGEKSGGINGNSMLFSGQMEMKSASESFDYQYLKRLKKHLGHIPKIKYLQEYASEKEMSVVFDIMEPLPLLDLLHNIPMVDKVIIRADDDICLIFKPIEQ